MRTLIIAPNWIGDALMAQPLLTLLKREDPEQQIIALAPSWVAPVLQAMPEVHDVMATKLAHGRLQLRDRWRFAQLIRQQCFDRAYVLPNSLKSALIPWLAGIRQRIGYVGEARYGVLNQRLPNPRALPNQIALPMVERYAALAKHAPQTLEMPHLVVAAEDIAQVRERFQLRVDQSLLALCPGAEYGPAKRWPAEHFAALIDLLRAHDAHCQIVLLGGPGDQSIANDICQHTKAKVMNLTGTTNLTEALALIAAADGVVSNDSGLMHVAAALQRPQVAVYGSSDPRHTPPLSSRAEILWLHLECSPCFERVCPLGHLRCLKEISAVQVFASLQRALSHTSAQKVFAPCPV